MHFKLRQFTYVYCEYCDSIDRIYYPFKCNNCSNNDIYFNECLFLLCLTKLDKKMKYRYMQLYLRYMNCSDEIIYGSNMKSNFIEIMSRQLKKSLSEYKYHSIIFSLIILENLKEI